MKLRICLPIIGCREWLGGVSYLENLVKSLQLLSDDERPAISLMLGDASLSALDLHYHLLPLFDNLLYNGIHGETVSDALGRPVQTILTFDELYEKIDFFFMPPDFVLDSRCSAAWIPDFQHIHLPQFFQANELHDRDESFRYKAEHARIMVLSSRDAERDFHGMFPNSTCRSRILPFHTLPEDSWLRENPEAIQLKYGLPDAFLICCNQFWIHKNHALLFNALALLKKRGITMSLVCTGSTNDYRCQGYFEELRRLIEQNEISDQVYILGSIPRADQIQLIRRSLAVVQPSLFEGWSTVVEDARALGKVQILSNLEVHREQSPDFAVFFDRTDPNALASVIQRLLPLLLPGPNLLRERSAEIAARRLVEEYGRTFCSIAREACELYRGL
jgi:glycosyltransferase involved in cell wall biosynthesis